MASKWIESATKDNSMFGKRGMRKLMSDHQEPDRDDMGGPSDYDADDMDRDRRKRRISMRDDHRGFGMD